MKIKKFIVKCILIGGILFTILFNFSPKSQQAYREVPQATNIETTQEVSTIDLQKNIMQQKITNAETLIKNISNDTEYILMTIDGSTTATHDSYQDDSYFKSLFFDSELTVKLNYSAILSIPTSKVSLTRDNNGLVYVNYNEKDVQVKSIDISCYQSQQDKAIFGHKYSHDELLSLVAIAKDHINTRISTSEKANKQCVNNLNNLIISNCKQYGVYGVNINGTTTITTPKYKFENMANVNYGHKREALTNIEYIIVHSTANVDVSASNHIKWLNNTPVSNAVHFYVDSDSVIQALDTNIQAQGTKGYNTATGADSHIKNSNSIQIEICEFSDKNKQLKVIENAEDFIRDVFIPELNKQGYYPKVVTHNESQGKNCPRILLGDEAIISWEEFLEKC